jgi:hypothetical protein
MNGRLIAGLDAKSAKAWDLSRFPEDPSIPGAQLYMFDGKGHNR